MVQRARAKSQPTPFQMPQVSQTFVFPSYLLAFPKIVMCLVCTIKKFEV